MRGPRNKSLSFQGFLKLLIHPSWELQNLWRAEGDTPPNWPERDGGKTPVVSSWGPCHLCPSASPLSRRGKGSNWQLARETIASHYHYLAIGEGGALFNGLLLNGVDLGRVGSQPSASVCLWKLGFFPHGWWAVSFCCSFLYKMWLCLVPLSVLPAAT